VIRPPVDLVVPFRGPLAERDALGARLAGLGRRSGDTVTIVDNTPGRAPPAASAGGAVRIVCATGQLTPGYARNRGAELGAAEWIVFLDADTLPVPDLLDRHFDPSPAPRTGLLAGGVIDQPVGPNGPLAPRYAELRRTLHQDRSLGMGRFGFAVAANLACRRAAFDAVDGFREDIRAGEDADLSLRLRAAGWEIERREAASVVHRSRPTVGAMLRQATLHGAGGAWIDRRHPGAFPIRRLPGLTWWGVRRAARGLAAYARRGDRDELVLGVMEPLWELAFEYGRHRPGLIRPERPPDDRRAADTLRRR
jgi:GT2 family glycosyltransferase